MHACINNDREEREVVSIGKRDGGGRLETEEGSETGKGERMFVLAESFLPACLGTMVC